MKKTDFFGKGGIGWFIVIGIPALLLVSFVGCLCYRCAQLANPSALTDGCCRYTRNVKRRMLKEKEHNLMEIQQTKAMLASNNDKLNTIEVEADLCQAVALQYADDIPSVMRIRPVASSNLVARPLLCSAPC